MKVKTLFSAALLHTAFLFPQTTSWNTSASSSWFTAGNWNNGVPNSAGAVATFPTTAAAVTVTLDTGSAIAGSLIFSDIPFAYTIAATSPNVLNLQGSAGTTAITITNPTDNAHIISAPMALMQPLTITQNSTSNTFTISGVMSGATSVTTAGAGATAFSGLNTYTGGTTVTAGTLDCNATTTLPAAGALTISGGTVICNAVNALPSSGTTTLSGGTLNINDNSQLAGPISGTSNITLGVLTATTLTSTTPATTSYSGVISGSGGFAVAGSGGVLTFTAVQTYTGGTTVSGSTLQLGITNALATAGALTVNSPGVFNLATFSQMVGVLAGSGSITFGAAGSNLTTNTVTNSTFSGSMSGPGSFTQAGTSTLTLTGVNSYTGGTTISAGTLQLGINNALASTGPVAIAAGGTLDMTPAASTVQAIGPLSGTGPINLGVTQLTINSTASSSYGGSMNGTGSLVVAGPQTLTLTGSNTFSGGTTVTGGTLAIGTTNALLPTGNLAVNSPGTLNLAGFSQTVGVLSGNGSITLGTNILTVNTPGGMTSNFSGVISQAGVLDVGNTGTLILTGANTYSGGTNVSAGATLQGNTTSLQAGIANSGTLIFNQTSSGTFNGTLTGTGSLILNGGGNLTLNGTQTQGSASITAGELILGTASNLVASPVTIAAGASLGTTGVGTITGAVTVNGTTQLGLGTINITGSYAQTAGSTFAVSVTPSSNGFLPVTGTVTLSGTPAIDIDIEKGIYAPTTTYTLITAGAPVVGTFAPPVFDNPFFEGTLLYNDAPGSVTLVLDIAPFGDVIKGGNAGAIAKCINLLAFPSESDLLPILETLIFLPVEEVRGILEEMQPSQLKALGLTEENNLVVIRSSISQHIDNLYKTECNQAATELYKWNVWSNFSGDFLRQQGQKENIAYSADTAAATVGIDAALAKNLFVGIAGAYDYSWLDWSHSRGHARISSFYAGPYFSWFNRRVFTNVSLLGTWNDYHASRHISFPTVDRHARSNHNGHGLIAHFDFGVLTYPAAEMTFSPIAGLDYIHLREQGYSEHDAGSLDLKIFPTHASLFRSELGLQIAKCAILVHNKWTHDLKLSWIHQFPMKGTHLHAQFKDVDCTFTVKGLKPNQDYFDVATGLTGVFMKDKLSGALRYEGKFGDGICDNTGYAQLTYRF